MTPETAMRQAWATIELYLSAVTGMLNDEHGEGYAKANPELVGKLVDLCQREYIASMPSIEVEPMAIAGHIEHPYRTK